MNMPLLIRAFLLSLLVYGCTASTRSPMIRDVITSRPADTTGVWLTHEHILVDFSGADNIDPTNWQHDQVIHTMLPYLEKLKKYHVSCFVDATPAYLGRDVMLLRKLSRLSGIRILTNTGFYGARNNLFIPEFALNMTAEELAGLWTREYTHGIEGTAVKPGFIKIGVDNMDPLDPFQHKLVKAAALTHLRTGLTIASHTGKAEGLWPQLKILRENGVSPEAFIWIHAQAESNPSEYLKAAKEGCWISLDGLANEKAVTNHAEKILFAKANGFLNRILISHDAGWYDPQNDLQKIRPYNVIFTKLYPLLLSKGFSEEDWHQLISGNPSRAFSIQKHPLTNNR